MQACIDDNISMVEFLVNNGAQINVADNEGWTPLHATASCGYIDIARSVPPAALSFIVLYEYPGSMPPSVLKNIQGSAVP